jgi:hypothetical protein
VKSITIRHASGREEFVHYCPACKDTHVATTVRPPGDSGPKWDLSGSPEHPSLSPSVRVSWGRTGEKERICHYFLKAGVFDYCSDSTHAMAGTRVPLPDMPKAEIDFWEGVAHDRSKRTDD